jgi:hypothetical protein
MTKKKIRRAPTVASTFDQARDELFSHILRCGVIEALPEHQKEWFDDTMQYLTERYEDLTDVELNSLRELGRTLLPAGATHPGGRRRRLSHRDSL